MKVQIFLNCLYEEDPEKSVKIIECIRENYTSFIKRSPCKWNRIRYWTDQEVNKVAKSNSIDFLATIKTGKTS